VKGDPTAISADPCYELEELYRLNTLAHPMFTGSNLSQSSISISECLEKAPFHSPSLGKERNCSWAKELEGIKRGIQIH
jgi:hypothetical protein